MKLRLILALLFITFSLNAMAEMKLSKYAKVYKGGEGAIVIFIPLSPKNVKKALIEVSGIDTEFDGLILLYDFENQGRSEAYKMKYDGRSSTRLRTNTGYWSKWTTLYLPDMKDGIELRYDANTSKQIDTSKFLERYLGQEKKGVQKTLATFKRDIHIAQAKEAFMDTAKSANKACGKEFSATIQWDKIKDEYLQKYSFSSYCGAVFSEIASLCKKSASSKTTINSKIDTVSCAFGDKLKLRLQNKTLSWITAGGAPNQSTFIKNYLMNEF